MTNCMHTFIILTKFEQSFDHRVCVKKQIKPFCGFPAKLVFSRGSQCTGSIKIQAPICVVSITSKSFVNNFAGENVSSRSIKSYIMVFCERKD